MGGQIDLLEELRRIQSMNTDETFDRATDSLEAIANAIAAMLNALIPVSGVHTHANNLLEQTVFTMAVIPSKIETIYLDLVNLTQNCTIRVYHQIDGVNPRVIETFNWTTGMDDGCYFRDVAVNASLQVTVQSAVIEGAIRNIPWAYLYRT